MKLLIVALTLLASETFWGPEALCSTPKPKTAPELTCKPPDRPDWVCRTLFTCPIGLGPDSRPCHQTGNAWHAECRTPSRKK